MRIEITGGGLGGDCSSGGPAAFLGAADCCFPGWTVGGCHDGLEVVVAVVKVIICYYEWCVWLGLWHVLCFWCGAAQGREEERTKPDRPTGEGYLSHHARIFISFSAQQLEVP